MSPLIILAIGIGSVLGLILVLRVNAFLALIVSAMVVSVLSPGEVHEKISRVAGAFGESAGNIAIVIGLAAIIGECMMASGAADRIVQAFLKLLGEKRASWALMGSGFVLSVPVFFDTVFYLLVPLARSLFRRTNKNYLLYILAISAGGAITHTLVPPTPGPLVMATTLGIDIGVMILVGALVAFPAAVAGLTFSAFLSRRMDIPFREEALNAPTSDAPAAPPVNTPPLLLSLLPVLLPIALISTNTALETLANAERTPKLQLAQITDWNQFETQLRETEGPRAPASARFLQSLPAELQTAIQQKSVTTEQRAAIVAALNATFIQKSPQLYDNQSFDLLIRKQWKIAQDLKAEKLPVEKRTELERELRLSRQVLSDLDGMKTHERERFNRLLFEQTFGSVVQPHEWETSLRRAAYVSQVFGNPNFALLMSTVVAMWLVFRQLKPTLQEMSNTVELALMSAGTIILITAAGGAFGAMLKVAGIGDAIKTIFSNGESATGAGITFLLLGYGIAALLKVAQGSSTTAMIVGSSMLASMIPGVELGFHPVYLATAIGAGSLMGSWMNDSGFWIFTKMGRLTESESLRSWTPLLAVLSLVSLTTTLILALILPLT